MLFVDTNVFLRFLRGDDPVMSEESERLFRRAQTGQVALYTSPLAIAEVAWTLKSFYGANREQVAEMLRSLLSMRGLRIEGEETLREAVELYGSTNVDFIDAYHAADIRRRGLTRVCSYDRDFDRLGVHRVEPGDIA